MRTYFLALFPEGIGGICINVYKVTHQRLSLQSSPCFQRAPPNPLPTAPQDSHAHGRATISVLGAAYRGLVCSGQGCKEQVSHCTSDSSTGRTWVPRSKGFVWALKDSHKPWRVSWNAVRVSLYAPALGKCLVSPHSVSGSQESSEQFQFYKWVEQWLPLPSSLSVLFPARKKPVCILLPAWKVLCLLSVSWVSFLPPVRKTGSKQCCTPIWFRINTN